MSDPLALGRRRRMLVLGICCMSLLIVGLDNTIVNVALPSLGKDLGASVSGLQWIVDAYTVVLASLLVLSGSIADRIGRRRVFQIGLLTFSAGSLLCSLAPSLGWLVASRVLQAIGGSMLNPVAMSIIRNVFTDPRERAQAIGVWGGVVGISMALGPLLGGLLVQSVGWPSIFWINVPVGIVALTLTALFVPESKAERPRRLDPLGQILVVATLGSLTYAIIEGPGLGWFSAETLSFVTAAAVCLVVFVFHESRREEPLIELRFFRSAPFSGATVIAVGAFAALGGFLFLNTLFLQDVRGLSPLEAGLYTLPIAAMTVVFGPLSGRLVGARGARPSLLAGGAGIALGSVLLTGLRTDTPLTLLVVAYSVFGFGFAVVNPPITDTAVAGMPPGQAGVAAAIASTSRQVGQSIGVAVVGALGVSSLAIGHHSAALARATHPGWWVAAFCGVAVFAVGAVSTTRWARRTAEDAAAHLDETPSLVATHA